MRPEGRLHLGGPLALQPGRVHPGGQSADGGGGIDVLDGDHLHRRIAAQQGDEPRRPQGVAAQLLEEVIGDRYGRRGEDLAPGLVQQSLRRGFRRHQGALRRLHMGRPGQGLAIHLAGDEGGQAVADLEGLGMHVAGKAQAQQVPQPVEIDRLVPGRRQEGREEIGAAGVREQGDHRLGHRRIFHQDGFDLPQFNAIAANLHLGIDAAQIVDVPRRGDPAQVTGAVGQFRCAGRAGKRGPDELFRGQVRTVQIAGPDPRSADQQLPLRARRQGGEVLAHDGGPVSGQGAADGHRLARHQFLPGGGAGGFAGTVGVHDPPSRPGPAPHQLGGAGFAAGIDQADRGDVLVHHRQQGRDRGPDGDSLPRQGRAQVRPGLGQGFRAHQQLGPRQEGAPHLLHRHIEGEGGPGIDPVLAADPQDRAVGPGLEGDVAVPDDGTLGLAGGAGGIDQIGRVLRIGPGVRACEGRRFTGGDVAQVPIQVHHRRPGRGKRRRPVAVRYHHAGGGFLGNVVGPVLGKAPVHRHIGGPGLEHAQDGHVLVEAAGQADHHPVAAGHAALPQVPRELRGPLAKLGIGQRGAANTGGVGFGQADGGALREAAGGLRKQFVQQFIAQTGAIRIGRRDRQDQVGSGSRHGGPRIRRSVGHRHRPS